MTIKSFIVHGQIEADNIIDGKLTASAGTDAKIEVSAIAANWWSMYGDLDFNITEEFGAGSVYDAAGNLYVVGTHQVLGLNDHLLLLKYDANGTLLWSKSYTQLGIGQINGESIIYDTTSGHLYVLTTQETSWFGVIELTTDGDIVRKVHGDVDYEMTAWDLTIDPSGNIYIIGDQGVTNINTGTSQVVFKLDSVALNFVWGKEFTLGHRVDEKYQGKGFGAVEYSNGYVYVTGGVNDGTISSVPSDPPLTQNYSYLAKLDAATGDQVWLQDTAGGVGMGLCLDDADNVYTTYTNNTEYGMSVIAKFDSSGVFQWARSLMFYQGGGDVDINYDNGYVYATGVVYDNTSQGPTYDGSPGWLHWAKVNATTGDVVYQQRFGHATNLPLTDIWRFRGHDLGSIHNGKLSIAAYAYESTSTSPVPANMITLQLPLTPVTTGTYGQYLIEDFAGDTGFFTTSFVPAGTGLAATIFNPLSTDITNVTTSTAVVDNTLTNYTQLISYSGTSGINTWTFAADGNLTLPSSTSIISYPDGSTYSGLGVAADTYSNLLLETPSINTTTLWINQFGGVSLTNPQFADTPANSCIYDAAGNVYVTGSYSDIGWNYTNPYIRKLTSTGSIVWEKTFVGNGSSGESFCFDNSGYLYWITGDCIVWKLNTTDGSVLWSTALTVDYVENIAVNSSGEVFAQSRYNITKLDNTGAFVKNIQFGGSITDGYSSCLIDTGNKLLFSAQQYVQAYNYDLQIIWETQIASNASNVLGLATDISGNWFVSYRNTTSGNYEILKIDGLDNTTILWQKSFVNSVNSGFITWLQYHNNKLYFTSANGNLSIAELNATDGSVSWVNELSYVNPASDLGQWYWYGHADVCVLNDYVAVVAYVVPDNVTAGNARSILAQFPSDGNGTGNYGEFFRYSKVSSSGITDITTAATTFNGSPTAESTSSIIYDNTLLTLTGADSAWENAFYYNISQPTWKFSTGGDMVLPANGNIYSSDGTNILNSLVINKLTDMSNNVNLTYNNYSLKFPEATSNNSERGDLYIGTLGSGPGTAHGIKVITTSSKTDYTIGNWYTDTTESRLTGNQVLKYWNNELNVSSVDAQSIIYTDSLIGLSSISLYKVTTRVKYAGMDPYSTTAYTGFNSNQIEKKLRFDSQGRLVFGDFYNGFGSYLSKGDYYNSQCTFHIMAGRVKWSGTTVTFRYITESDRMYTKLSSLQIGDAFIADEKQITSLASVLQPTGNTDEYSFEVSHSCLYSVFADWESSNFLRISTVGFPDRTLFNGTSVQIHQDDMLWQFCSDGSLKLPKQNPVIDFTPSTPSDWNGTPPTTIQEAINRLAAVVKQLNGGTGA